MNETVAISGSGGCPYSGGSDDRRTVDVAGYGPGPAIEKGDEMWIVRNFSLARQVLKSANVRQCGFQLELFDTLPASFKRPVIFLEGQQHRDMRRGTMKYFTPKAVADNYLAPMEKLADRIIGDLKRTKSAKMDDIGLQMAMEITAQIVGLTNSNLMKMARVLEKTVGPIKMSKKNPFYKTASIIRGRISSLKFYYGHVKPAIQARRKEPKEDVISHLLSLGYDDPSILIECSTYAPAGMSTTREFMTLAMWHFLDRPQLKARFLSSTDEQKRDILDEILRLEPIVSQIDRRAMADVEVTHNGETIVIPKGTYIRIDTRGANHDPEAAGECPFSLDPDRKVDKNMTGALLTFSDGNHRCPGRYVALQESAIFLTKLLEIPGLSYQKPPKLTRNPQVGFEARDFILTLQ